MTHDLEVLRAWIRIVLLITCVAVTSFPILYSFTPWKSRPVGRLLMFQGIAFAVAVDVSYAMAYWRPLDILVLFWINAIILTLISLATSLMSIWVVRMNRPFFRFRKRRR